MQEAELIQVRAIGTVSNSDLGKNIKGIAYSQSNINFIGFSSLRCLFLGKLVKMKDIVSPNTQNEYNDYIDKNINEIKDYIKKNVTIQSEKTYHINSRKVTEEEYKKHKNKDFSDDFFNESDAEGLSNNNAKKL